MCTEQTVAKLANSILSPGNNAFFPFLYTYSSGRYPSSERVPRKIASSFAQSDTPITTLIFSIDSGRQLLREVKKIACRLKNKVANNLTLWFYTADILKDTGQIKAVLGILSQSNPYTIWNIILETGVLPSQKSISEIEKSISYQINHWDYLNVFAQNTLTKEYKRQAARIVVIVPFDNRFGQQVKYKESVSVFRSVYIDKIESQLKIIKHLTGTDCDGLLIDFSPGIPAGIILDCLEFISLKKGKKIIRLKNRLLQTVWDTKYNDQSVCTAGDVDLGFVYDRNLNEQILHFSRKKVRFDYLDWNLSLEKSKHLAA